MDRYEQKREEMIAHLVELGEPEGMLRAMEPKTLEDFFEERTDTSILYLQKDDEPFEEGEWATTDDPDPSQDELPKEVEKPSS